MHAALEQARDQHVTVVAASGDTGAISDDGPPRAGQHARLRPAGAGGRRHHPGRDRRPAPTTARWPGTSGDRTPPAAATAACSPGRPTRTASPGPAPPAASPTSPPTPTPPPPWRSSISGGGLRPAQGTSAATPLWAGVIALADQQAGQHLGFVNPAIYPSPAAPPTTRPSTTWSPATTRCSGPPASSPATPPDPAGTRSPAGAAPTPSTSSPSWHVPRARAAYGPDTPSRTPAARTTRPRGRPRVRTDRLASLARLATPRPGEAGRG